MSPKKHIIIYSHGFGVRKDDSGLLSDIASSLPEVESILFDYYEIDELKHTITTCPFSVQVEKLNQIVNETRRANPDAVIDLIAHSQGTVVAALAKPEGIRKAVLLAPPFDLGLERTLSRYSSRPDADINLDGVSKLPPLEGLVRIVPKEYWLERVAVKTIPEYNAFAEKTEIIAIEAAQDQLLPKVDLKELSPRIKLISLAGDHNFNSSAREPLIATIRELLI